MRLVYRFEFSVQESGYEKKFCNRCDFADEGHPIDDFYCHECSYSNGQHFIEKEDE